jgi:acetoin:2,6-dichlorophenolindophenol oxidoreductase subunit beta
MKKKIKYYQAINEALSLSLKKDKNVYLIGLGIADPKGIFGTTTDLQKKYGKNRVMDMPTAENGMTGIAIGTAIGGLRPVISHQRVEFALLSMEQIINQAAKWHYMTGGEDCIPLVIRLIVGRGWGQGPQHAQNLESLFAHIPGLKVVSPSNAYDAKGLLISSILDKNPVIFYEHRWLHNTYGFVDKEYFEVPIGKAKIIEKGIDITLVSNSYMIIECLKCVKFFKKNNVSIELVDLRTIRPLDKLTIIKSVRKTKRLVVVDNSWQSFGVSAEIVSTVVETKGISLLSRPARLGFAEVPSPSTRALINDYYPDAYDIALKIKESLKINLNINYLKKNKNDLVDIPDKKFTGPF